MPSSASAQGLPQRISTHVIGDAHIGPVQRWRWQRGHAEVLATCRAAVEVPEDPVS